MIKDLENKAILKKYEDHIKLNLKFETVNSYLEKVTKFISYLEKHNIKLCTFSVNEIIDFTTCTLPKTSPSLKYITISAIKNFVHFLNLKEINVLCRYNAIKLPKIKKHQLKLYTRRELKTIFDLSKNNRELNIMLILALFYGFTTNELCKLKISDINAIQSTITTIDRKLVHVNFKYIKELYKLSHINGENIFKMQNKAEISKECERCITQKSNIDKISFKALNNICILNHIRQGLNPIEISYYFNVSIVTANKLENDYNSNKSKLSRLLS